MLFTSDIDVRPTNDVRFQASLLHFIFAFLAVWQPRPQGLLLDDFQNGGSSGEGPFSRRAAILKIVEKKALGTRLVGVAQNFKSRRDINQLLLHQNIQVFFFTTFPVIPEIHFQCPYKEQFTCTHKQFRFMNPMDVE